MLLLLLLGRGSDTKQYHNTFLGSDSFSYLTGICLKGGGVGATLVLLLSYVSTSDIVYILGKHTDFY